MISLKEKMIVIGEKSEPIKSFEVWFRTPSGIFPDLRRAVENCEKNEIPIDGMISPVSVAVGSTLYEEIGR